MVDDSEVIRQLIRVNLELEGFEVVTAADGAECLEIVEGVQPDVVTLDVVMPRLDGLRTAARLRCDPGTSHLRIAIVSACTPADLAHGESVGVDGYLGKPFDPDDLVRLVQRLMDMPSRVMADRVTRGSATRDEGSRESVNFGGVLPAYGLPARLSPGKARPDRVFRSGRTDQGGRGERGG